MRHSRLLIPVLLSLGGLAVARSPQVLSAEPALPKLTVPISTVKNFDAASWCRAKDGRGRRAPFDVTRARLYTDLSDPKKPVYLIGCLTNNSRSKPEGVGITCQSESSSGSFNFSSFSFPAPARGQTVYFKGTCAASAKTTAYLFVYVAESKNSSVVYTTKNLQQVIFQPRKR